MGNIDNIMRDIEDGTFKKLGKNDRFTFDCQACGKCCTNREDIILKPFDIYNISKYLKIKPIDFYNKYCQTHIGYKTKLPIVILKYKDIIPNQLSICPFLKPQKNGRVLCEIHKVKPTICALYPLGRLVKANDEGEVEYQYFVQPVECDGSKTHKTVKVKQWLADFDFKPHDKAMEDFSQFIHNAYKELNFMKMDENKSITDKTKQMIYQAFIGEIYLNYSHEKDFFVQEKENFEKFVGVLSVFADLGDKMGMNIKSTKS